MCSKNKLRNRILLFMLCTLPRNFIWCLHLAHLMDMDMPGAFSALGRRLLSYALTGDITAPFLVPGWTTDCLDASNVHVAPYPVRVRRATAALFGSISAVPWARTWRERPHDAIRTWSSQRGVQTSVLCLVNMLHQHHAVSCSSAVTLHYGKLRHPFHVYIGM